MILKKMADIPKKISEKEYTIFLNSQGICTVRGRELSGLNNRRVPYTFIHETNIYLMKVN